MRRYAAILMLILFASLNAIEGMYCPDSCTHEQAWSAGAPATYGGCVLCAGAVHGQVAARPSPGVSLSTVVTRVASTNPGDVSPDAPEHPPRA